MNSSRLGVLLVESVFRLKIVLTLALIFNSFLFFAGILSSFYFGLFWAWISFFIAFIFNCVIVLKVARGFNYEELIKNE